MQRVQPQQMQQKSHCPHQQGQPEGHRDPLLRSLCTRPHGSTGPPSGRLPPLSQKEGSPEGEPREINLTASNSQPPPRQKDESPQSKIDQPTLLTCQPLSYIKTQYKRNGWIIMQSQHCNKILVIKAPIKYRKQLNQ